MTRALAILFLSLVVAGCASQRVQRATNDTAGGPFAAFAGEELWIIAAPQSRQMSDGGERRLRFRRLAVGAHIADDAAIVHATQYFHNPHDVALPATIPYTLPERATLTDFLLLVGERRIRGIITPEDEARTLFLAARAQGLTALLIDAGADGQLRQRLAAVPPGSFAALQLTYVDPLAFRDGAYTWTFVPPDAARDASHADIAFEVAVTGTPEPQAIDSPTHPIDVVERADAYRIHLDRALGDEAFVLRLRYADGRAALPPHPPIELPRSGVAIDASR